MSPDFIKGQLLFKQWYKSCNYMIYCSKGETTTWVFTNIEDCMAAMHVCSPNLIIFCNINTNTNEKYEGYISDWWDERTDDTPSHTLCWSLTSIETEIDVFFKYSSFHLNSMNHEIAVKNLTELNVMKCAVHEKEIKALRRFIIEDNI